MLDLMQTLNAARPNDVSSQNGKRPSENSAREENAQEFASEYDSAAAQADTGASRSPANNAREDENGPDTIASQGESKDNSEDVGGDTTDELDTEISTQPAKAEAGDQDDPKIKKQVGSESVLQNRVSNSGVDSTFPVGTEQKLKNGTAPATEESVRNSGLMPERKTKTTAESIVMSKTMENAEGAKPGKDARAVSNTESIAADVAEKKSQNDQVQTRLVLTNPVEKADSHSVDEARLQKKQDIATLLSEARVDQRRDAQAQKAQQIAPNLVAMAPKPLAKDDSASWKTDITLSSTKDLDVFGVSDPRTATHATAAANTQIFARADTPALVARQMAEALQRLPDRPVEISLNPSELGRVRMNVSAAETGITVTVMAERPETLDLMRRNIEQLTREFQAIGYESIDFAFSGNEAEQGFKRENSARDEHGPSHVDLTQNESIEISNTRAGVTTGVDIRL